MNRYKNDSVFQICLSFVGSPSIIIQFYALPENILILDTVSSVEVYLIYLLQYCFAAEIFL